MVTDPSVYSIMAVGLICAIKLLKIAWAFGGLAVASDFVIGNENVLYGSVAHGGGGLSCYE